MKKIPAPSYRPRGSAVILSLICLANLSSWGVAATINWDTVSVISGDTDVSTVGSADRAWLFGGGSTTINGVTFTAFGGGDTQVDLGGAYGGFGEGSPFGDLSAAYRTLLTNGYYANGTTGSVTLNNLNIGLDYQVQAWVNDSRGCCSGRSESISGSGSLAYSTLPGQSGGVGSFVTGNFTADATNQVLSITANQSAQINGLQLRATGVSAGNTATITSAKNWTALTIGSGATLKYNLPASSQQSTALTGAGSLEQSGTGVLTLTAAQTYTGATNITSGTLRPATAIGSTLWLDAAKTSSLTTSGTAVSQWNDAAGGVNFASQGTPAAQPNLSSDNAFTGVSKAMVDFGPNGNSGQTMLFNNNLTDIRSAFWVMKGSGFLLGSTGAYEFHRDGALDATSNIWHATYTAANIKTGQTYLNGALVDGTTTALSGGYQMIDLVTAGNVQANSLANDRNNGGRIGGQQIGEVIIFNTALTTTERERVESYLNYKWFGIGSGVGDLLPATTAVNISGGGTLDLSGVNYQTVASLASEDSSSRVTLGSAAFTVGDAVDTTFAGTISEGGSLIKQGAGKLTLTGENTYTNLTVVNAGTLQLGNGTTSNGSIAGNASNNATLAFANPNAQTYAGVISGTGAVTKSGAGVLTLTEAQTYTGATNITGGTLRLQGQATLPVLGAARQFDASTLVVADGTGVATWNDLSGNGHNATVPSGNATPTFIANAGTGTGLGALNLPGNGGAAASGAYAFARDTEVRSIFSIFKGDSFIATDSSTYALHRPSDGNSADALLANHGQVNYLGAVYVNGALVADPFATAMPTGTNNGYNLVAVITNGTAFALDSFNKDRGNIHSGNQSQAEVLIYDSVLTEAQRLHNEAYLLKKWFGTTAAGFGNATLPSTTSVTISGAGVLDLNNSDQTIGSLSATDASGTQVLLSAGTLTVGNALSTTFDGVISGVGSVLKQGVGTLTLTGENTYTNLTMVNAGTLQLGNGTTSNGSIAGSVRTNATLAFANPNAQTYAGVISGTGAVTKSGAGALTLNANNSFAGGLTISGGTLVAGSDSALGAVGSSIVVQSGASLDINGRTLQNYTQNIQIAGTGTSPTLGALGNGGGGNQNAIRGITLTANASIGGDGGRWDIGRLDFNGDPNSTVDHITGGGFVLTKVGSNYLGLLTGATNLAGFVGNGGTVAPHENTAFGAGPVTWNTGILQPWGGLNFSNAFTFNGGTVQTDGFSDNYNGPITLGGPVTINPTNGVITFNGNVSGSGDLTKTGNNWLVITGNNTQTGLLTVNGGHVRFSSATGNATQGNISMTNAGSFLTMSAPNQFGPNSGVLFNSPGHSEMALYGNDQTIASLASTNIFAVIQNSHSNIGAATASSTLTVNQNTDTVYSGYIRDNTGNDAFKLGLTKSGSGKLTLEGGNITYTGITTITNGTLALGTGAGLADTNTVMLTSATSSFDISTLTAASDKIGAFSSVAGSTVNLGAKTLEFGDSLDATAAGNFSGTGGSITKTGSGMQTLSGNNTYSGSTNLSGGTLLMGNSNTLPDTAALNLSSGTTLKTGGFSDNTGTLSVNGNAVIDMAAGDSVLNFNSVGTWTGTLSVWNYTGAPWTLGTDKLTFANDLGNIDLTKVEFYSDNGTGLIGTGGGGLYGNELVPVPEPSSALAAALLLGTLGYRERRRLMHFR